MTLSARPAVARPATHLLWGLLALQPPLVFAELPVPCGGCGGQPFVGTGAAQYFVNPAATTGTVTQTTDRAILNWQSFNVGAGNRVEFKQPGRTSATLNRIHQADPSRILGSIDANGQVFLINQNGFLFGNGARVDTRAFTASALDVSDQVFNTLGITGAINANPSEAVTSALPAFSGTPAPNAKIEIENGARLTAAERVMIVAPEIVNKGTIETPDGQSILAASHDKVYLASDSELRGLLVEVETGGTVSNLGEIIAERGNATLVGLAVNQAGRVKATTSVNVNGTIRLLARDGADTSRFTVTNQQRRPVASRAGTLTFAPGSVTEVTPEESEATARDAQPQSKSRIEAMARRIHVQSGARITATGGDIDMIATSRPDVPLGGGDAGARIQVEAGSEIDVSGAKSAVVPMTRNQGRVRLFGNELAGSPVQRNGILRGKEIAFDLRRGTAVANVSQAYNDISRSVQERLSTGGSVSLQSEGDVILQPGSRVSFGGGLVTVQEGFLETTRLLRAGRVFDISEANPTVIYDGIFGSLDVTYEKWGVRENYKVFENGNLSVFNPGYVQGMDAGSFHVSGNAGVVLNGILDGSTTRGLWQRESPGTAIGLARPYDEVALRGRLELSRGGNASNTNLRLVETPDSNAIDFAAPLPSDFQTRLAASLLQESGPNRIEISVPGAVAFAPDLMLDLGLGGLLEISANRLLVAGSVTATGGEIALTALALGTTGGEIEVLPDARLDTAGRWVNDRSTVLQQGSLARNDPLALDGGRITIVSEGDLTLGSGSLLDVGAGAWRDARGELHFGTPGAITLSGGIPELATPTRFELGATLRGFGFEAGGALSLRTSAFAITESAAGDLPPGALALPPAFFQAGGFADFTLAADRGGFLLAPGTRVTVEPLARQLTTAAFTAPSGTSLDAISLLAAPQAHLRFPTHLSASVNRVTGIGDAEARIDIGAGSELTVRPEGSITFSADSDILVQGVLRAPAGEISLAVVNAGGSNDLAYRSEQSLYLDDGALLDVAGIADVLVDRNGRRVGEVLDGGRVTLNTSRGHIITAPGSRIDVRGTSAELDLLNATTLGQVSTETLASAGGHLVVTAGESVLLGGALLGGGGGEGVSGGVFEVNLNPNLRDPGDLIATAAQNNSLPPGLRAFLRTPRTIMLGTSPVAIPLPGAALPDALAGVAQFDVNALATGGFDDLKLKAEPVITFSAIDAPGTIAFANGLSARLEGMVDLDATVFSTPVGTAALSAPLIRLGPTNPLFRPTAVPQAGDGRLVLSADHIDLRANTVFDRLSTQSGVPALTLSSTGDIRLLGRRYGGEASRTLPGSLTTLADVALNAARLYPATLTAFTFNLTRNDSRVVINRTGTDVQIPYSVAGELTFNAGTIAQSGTLVAPFGTLSLNARTQVLLGAGSVTSTSGQGASLLFGQGEFGTDWIYPLGDVTRVIAEAPLKRILLEAPDIEIAPGARVDISGGGEIRNFEFIPGPGGPTDILAANNAAGAFAILPGLSTFYGVFDPLESTAAGIDVGSTITLRGGNGTPEGTFARLPARFALLPGAFLVTPVEGLTDLTPFASPVRSDGATSIAGGKLGQAANGSLEARWHGYVVENGAQVRTNAEYREFLGNPFFSAREAGIPNDAGQLGIQAQARIALGGTLDVTTAAGGRGALFDIAATRLAVVNARGDGTGQVELLASELARFSGANLLLGGSRTVSGSTAALDVIAEEVSILPNVSLAAQEIVLAATRDVTLGGGAELSSSGAPQARAIETYQIDGDGAFARVSVDGPVTLDRTGTTGADGDLTLEALSVMTGTGSITLESTRDFTSRGALVTQGALDLTAALVNLGNAPLGAGGLTLSPDLLSGLEAQELRLKSRSTVDFYDNAALQGLTVVIDAPALRGFASIPGDNATVTAATLTLLNSVAATAAAPGTGVGTLTLTADAITLGAGTQAASGFARVDLVAGDAFRFAGDGSWSVAGDLAIAAPVVNGDAGATSRWSVAGDFTTRAGGGAPDAASAGLGARLDVAANGISHGSAFLLPSGVLELRATGAPGVTLETGSVIDVAGRDVDFRGITRSSWGGTVDLIAEAGDVLIDSFARIDVSGGLLGGDAGTLHLEAASDADVAASAVLLGGSAAATRGATFSVKAGSFVNGFSALNTQLNSGGFLRRRAFALGQGNLAVGATDAVTAEAIHLSAENGALDIAGTLDARSAQGGRLGLYASGDVTVHGTASLDARARDNGGDGGEIELGTRLGTITLSSGALLDVAGLDAGGARSDTGLVRLRAPRIGSTGVQIGALQADVLGASEISLEAFQSYNASTVNTALINTMNTDSQTFFGNAPALLTTLGVALDGRYRVAPGVEVTSAGDLTISSRWDLLTQRYGGAPGILTLRAGGSLLINQTLSDGILNARVDNSARVNLRDLPQTGDSWSFRLSAGANLGSADPLATTGSTGSVQIANNTRVLTGTGDIRVAAADDLVLQGTNSALYTLGRDRGTGAFTAFELEVLAGGDFLQEGGDVDIAVGGDLIGFGGITISSTAPSRVLPDWLPRVNGVRAPISGLRSIDYPVSWAVDHNRFRGGVGALGGGNVNIAAGGGMENLTVAVPTNGLPLTLTDGELDVDGGGNIHIALGESLRGGMLLIDAGSASVRVDGGLSANTAKSLQAPVFALGDATLSVQARNGLAAESIFNPTMAAPHPRQGNASSATDVSRAQRATFFFTYANDSAVTLATLAGLLDLASNGTQIRQAYQGGSAANGDRTFDAGPLSIVTPTLRALNYEGSIEVRGTLQLFPSPEGDFSLIAGDSIFPTGTAQILMSDADVALLPQPSAPAPSANGVTLTALLNGRAPVPVHAADATRATVIARDGSIGSTGVDVLSLTLPKQVLVSAGTDIANLGLDIQHSRVGTALRPVAVENSPALLERLADALLVEDLEQELLTSDRLDSLAPAAIGLVEIPDESLGAARARKVGVLESLTSRGGGLAETERSQLENLIAAIFSNDSLNATALLGLSPEFNGAAASSLVYPVVPVRLPTVSDHTEVLAGRDVLYTTPRRPDGTLQANAARLRVAGAGTLDIVAGRDVDLGSSSGVETSGNLQNAVLPARGADIHVTAGNATPPDFALFAEYFLLPGTRYEAFFLNVLGLGDTLRENTVTAREAVARAAFASLGDAARREVAFAPFYRELEAGGTGLLADYTRSNLAIATLFPLAENLAEAEDPRELPGIDIPFPAVAALEQMIVRELRLDGTQSAASARNNVIDKLELAAEKQSNDLSRAIARAVTAGDTVSQARLSAQQARLDGELRPALAAARGGTAFTPGLPLQLLDFEARQGNVKSLLSRFSTLDGGDINFMVPGGFVNAGVASSGTFQKDPTEIGIVVQGAGDIRAFVADDFEVNSSRVFALDGGDIFILSAVGDIDAGRGARSALSIPPPVTTFDAQGNAVTEFPAAIAGSGIQAAVSTPDRPPGDVGLIAPLGVVDAGDAGISAAGNLTITATAVLGADNISVGGTSTGVPTTSVSVPVGLANASAAASSATNSATSGASDQATAGGDGDAISKALNDSLVSIVSVQFIGFGE